jgi:hypothetical protein
MWSSRDIVYVDTKQDNIVFTLYIVLYIMKQHSIKKMCIYNTAMRYKLNCYNSFILYK